MQCLAPQQPSGGCEVTNVTTNANTLGMTGENGTAELLQQAGLLTSGSSSNRETVCSLSEVSVWFSVVRCWVYS